MTCDGCKKLREDIAEALENQSHFLHSDELRYVLEDLAKLIRENKEKPNER